jgi:hypothetical protein
MDEGGINVGRKFYGIFERIYLGCVLRGMWRRVIKKGIETIFRFLDEE